MQFPFNSNKQYLTPADQRALDKFLADEPVCKDIYERASTGEKRLVVQVRYPFGAIFPTQTANLSITAYQSGPSRDGGRNYHTPLAKCEDGKAHVMYEDMTTGEMLDVTGDEWLKWLKAGEYTVSAKGARADTPQEIAARRALMAEYASKQKVVDAEKVVAASKKGKE